jgi:hypothetical protein
MGVLDRVCVRSVGAPDPCAASSCEGKVEVAPAYVFEHARSHPELPWEPCSVCGLPILIEAEVLGPGVVLGQGGVA